MDGSGWLWLLLVFVWLKRLFTQAEADAHPSSHLALGRPGHLMAAVPAMCGWCLKKGNTEKSWARAHYGARYFVSRGHALCYFERPSKDAGSAIGGEHLLGVIDLREVIRVQPSADATAPKHAIDIVLRKRTYTLSPQPQGAEATEAWFVHWSVVAPSIVDPSLLPKSREAGAAAADPLSGAVDASATPLPAGGGTAAAGGVNTGRAAAAVEPTPAAASHSAPHSPAHASAPPGARAGASSGAGSSGTSFPAPSIVSSPGGAAPG